MTLGLFDYGAPFPVPSCVLSPCERYRYELRVPVSTNDGTCLFIMANPSTAVVTDGVFQSDPTITRCIGYARRWGYGMLLIGNVRAWRETDPDKVPPDPEAIGPDNDGHLIAMARRADVVVGGWGKLGGTRGSVVRRMLHDIDKPIHALKLNADGSPAHPLYLAANLQPVPMEAR